MPPTDEERLVVSLEARIRDFEKNFQKAERTGSRTYQQLAAGSTRATRQMETDMVRSTSRINQALATTSTRIGSFGKAFIGGLALGAGIAGLEGIRQAAMDSTKSILEMGDSAKRAGVSFKAFQELKFVAEQSRIGVDALTDGLKELSLRADEFIKTGQGSAAESFQRLGYDAETLAEKLKEPDQLFLEIIGKLEKLDKAAQIRIADELFGGTGGEKFVQLITKGEAGIRKQIQAANDLGIVMDEQMIAKAEEVNQKFDLIATTVGTKLKEAVVNALSEWFRFIDSYKEFKNQQGSTLSDRQSTLGQQRVDLENEKMKIQNGEGGFPYWNKDGPLAKGRIHEIELELAKIAAEERQIVDELNKRVQSIPTTSPSISTPTTNPTLTTAAGKGMLSLIGAAEGTDKGRGYNETLGFGKFTGGDKNLVLMTLDEIDAMQSQMLRHPDNDMNSSAAGRYQIVQKTLRGLRGKLGLKGSDYFDQGMQDRLAEELLRQRGNDPAGLRNEWEGLRKVDDKTIRSAYDTTSVGMAGMDPGIADKNEKMKEQADTYDEMIAKAREFIAEQGMESQALGMSTEAAARLRYEQELLNEARQAGLDLSPTQIESIKALAAEMARAEAQTKRLAESQEDAQKAATEFGSEAKGVVKGFINDLRNGESSADAFKNALGRIADIQLDNLLNMVFGGGGKGGEGGGLLGAIFSGIMPKHARGTNNAPGGPSLVGEDGPEIVNMPRGAQVIPNHQLRRGQQSSGGGKMAVDVGVSVDNNGNLQAYVKSVSRQQAGGIAQQATRQGLRDYQKSQERGGFGTTQDTFTTDKG